jgi:hypothetical protein
VQRAWEKWDIRKVLEANWTKLAPKLKNKLHVWCGANDTVHLELAVGRLCESLRAHGSNATCEIVPDKTHFDMYGSGPDALGKKDGLFARFTHDMRSAFDGKR